MQDFGMVILSREPLGQQNICLSDSHFNRVRDGVWRGYVLGALGRLTYVMSKRCGFFSFLAFKVYSLTFSLMLNNKSLSSIRS